MTDKPGSIVQQGEDGFLLSLKVEAEIIDIYRPAVLQFEVADHPGRDFCLVTLPPYIAQAICRKHGKPIDYLITAFLERLLKPPEVPIHPKPL